MSHCQTECADAVRDIAYKAGARVTIGTTGGNHQVAVFALNGRTRKLFFSGTPSCQFAIHHIKGDARRTLRAMGAAL